MLLDFRRLDSYPLAEFDGTCFAIPVNMLKKETCEQLVFSQANFDYYLACGRIDGKIELLFFGTFNEGSREYGIRGEEAYFVPLSLISAVPAARLPHLRLFKNSPAVKAIAFDYLKRKGRAAQRLDRSLDHLRIPDYPDSLLVFTTGKGTSQAKLQAICLDRLKLIGPGLYLGYVHEDRQADLGYAAGEAVYAKKIISDQADGSPSARLLTLAETPALPKVDIQYAEPQGEVKTYRGLCLSCNKERFIHAGEEHLDALAFERCRQEIMLGIWGIPLYAYALSRRRVRLRSFRRPYFCRHCGSRAMHRTLRLEGIAEPPADPAEAEGQAGAVSAAEASFETRSTAEAAAAEEACALPAYEEYLPVCTVCGQTLTPYEGEISHLAVPCRGCEENYVWQELSAEEARAAGVSEPPYLPEDFCLLSLKEAALLAFDFARVKNSEPEPKP